MKSLKKLLKIGSGNDSVVLRDITPCLISMRTLHNVQFAAIILVLFLFAAPLCAQPSSSSAPGKRVLVISVDGMRPDVLLRAKAPNVRDMLQHGAFTFWAESTDVAITLPTHVSMLTGVTPAKHRITWNNDLMPAYRDLTVLTLFELAKKAGFSTAMVVGKKKLGIIAKTGTVDWFSVTEKTADDGLTVARQAVSVLREHTPQVLFVHFPEPDTVGHAMGWGSPQQVAALDKTDQGIGMILSALQELGLREQTLVILTADHGGSGRSHGAQVQFSHYIPWIAVGPGVQENYDLTRDPALSVHVEDVFATALDFLGVAIPPATDGKPVRAIYGKRK